MTQIGEKVTDFALPSTNDKTFKLSDHLGSHIIIYFYPKDNTPGCTQEGQDFRDFHQEFKANNAIVVGVSRDSIKKHENFKAKFEFPFELLADTEEKLCKQFDVIKEKSMYGRKYLGIERSTFLIDKTGVLQHEWRKVKVKGHADEVLQAVKSAKQ